MRRNANGVKDQSAGLAAKLKNKQAQRIHTQLAGETIETNMDLGEAKKTIADVQKQAQGIDQLRRKKIVEIQNFLNTIDQFADEIMYMIIGDADNITFPEMKQIQARIQGIYAAIAGIINVRGNAKTKYERKGFLDIFFLFTDFVKNYETMYDAFGSKEKVTMLNQLIEKDQIRDMEDYEELNTDHALKILLAPIANLSAQLNPYTEEDIQEAQSLGQIGLSREARDKIKPNTKQVSIGELLGIGATLEQLKEIKEGLMNFDLNQKLTLAQEEINKILGGALQPSYYSNNMRLVAFRVLIALLIIGMRTQSTHYIQVRDKTDDIVYGYLMSAPTPNDRSTTEDDQATAEDDKTTGEDDKATAEDDKATAEDDKATTEDDKATTEDDKATAEDNKAAATPNNYNEIPVEAIKIKVNTNKAAYPINLLRDGATQNSDIQSLLENAEERGYDEIQLARMLQQFKKDNHGHGKDLFIPKRSDREAFYAQYDKFAND